MKPPRGGCKVSRDGPRRGAGPPSIPEKDGAMRDRQHIGRWFLGLSVIGLCLAGSARAQEVTTAPTAVRACLCARELVSVREREMKESRKVYDDSQRAADALTRQVDEARPKVDTENADTIEAFRKLLARRDEAVQAFTDESRRYSAQVARYNDAVAGDNSACGGRLFDTAEVETEKQNLSCPRE
jgi:hypothetical protein